MSLLPSYQHIVNRRLKHTYLSFDAEGELIIRSPRVSQKYIEALLLKKSAWITRSQKKIREKKGKPVSFDTAPELYYLGRHYPLLLQTSPHKRSTLTFDQEKFILTYTQYDPVLFQRKIDAFYRKMIQNYLPPLVEHFSKKMNLPYNKLSFRKTKRQWGSCSGQNNLSFNTMLMKLPEDVIEYIVVHELAHIQHKHHQQAFWACVAVYLPDYKTRIATLKTFST